MRTETRTQYNAYLTQLQTLNGVPSAVHTFAVEPTVQQSLETRIQESSAFLSRVNSVGVRELKGEKVGIGVSSTIASRTDTTGSLSRVPRDVHALDAQGYECKQTNFDTYVGYSLLDSWAKFPDFQTRLRNSIVQRQALDRLMIGFHGKSAALTTDLATSPLLEDVNIGWLEHYRTQAPERVLDKGKGNGNIKVGVKTGNDYRNLDALVFDVVSALIDPWHRKNPGLVVILGRDLMHDKYFPLVNADQPPTEKIATDLILSQHRVGGLKAVEVPYIPDGTALITTLSNLSLYWQISGRRRYLKEVPEKNRIENYESSNDAYVVEDYGLGCLVENIEMLD